jgi:integrase
VSLRDLGADDDAVAEDVVDTTQLRRIVRRCVQVGRGVGPSRRPGADLAFTGLRWGEAIALTVADVEFLKRRISVHRNAVQVGQDFEVGQTKGKENRTASVLSRPAVRCEGRQPTDLLFPRGAAAI